MMMWARGPSRPARPDNEFVVQEFRSSGVQEFVGQGSQPASKV